MSDLTRVLIIDDDMAAARLLELALERNGPYQVRAVNQPTRACEIARAFQPHIILLDVVMPEIDGGEVASRLRAQPDLKHIPIIFLTSLIGGQDTNEGTMLSGGYPFLPKPANMTKVIEMIEKSLRAAHAKSGLAHTGK